MQNTFSSREATLPQLWCLVMTVMNQVALLQVVA